VDGPGFMGSMAEVMNKFKGTSDDTEFILKDAAESENKGIKMAEELVRGDLDDESRKVVEKILDVNRSMYRSSTTFSSDKKYDIIKYVIYCIVLKIYCIILEKIYICEENRLMRLGSFLNWLRLRPKLPAWYRSCWGTIYAIYRFNTLTLKIFY